MKTSRATWLISAILFAVVQAADAANYYVATNGNDSAAGTSVGTAWLTINKAMNTVAAGDTVNIGEGEYDGDWNTVTSGTALNPIYIIGPLSTNAVLTNGQVDADVNYYDVSYLTFNNARIETTGASAHNWNVHHCMVSNNVSRGWVWMENAATGPFTNGPSGWVVHHNTSQYWAVDGVVLLMGIGNMVLSNRFGPVNTYDVIRMFGRDHIIRDNHFRDLLSGTAASPTNTRHGDIVQTFDNSTDPDEVWCRDILFERNYVTNCSMQFGNIEMQYGSTNMGGFIARNNIWINSRIQININNPGYEFYHNTIYSNTVANGFRFSDGGGTSDNGRVYNNLFVQCDSFYSFRPALTNMSADYNLITDLFGGAPSAPDEGPNGILGGYGPNDIFVDPAAGNLRIKAGAPVINAGTNLLSFVDSDFDGVSRSSTPTMGAFEYVASENPGSTITFTTAPGAPRPGGAR